MDRIDAFEGMLQRAWDRLLSRKPVLLLLVGSDLSMMEALNSYDRPFHQRGREMVVGPLNPADIGEMLDLSPAAAFDAALITGGLPLICAEWRPGRDAGDSSGVAGQPDLGAAGLRRALTGRGVPTAGDEQGSPAGHRSGERTFTNIARAAGGIAHTTLTRAMDVLTEKGRGGRAAGLAAPVERTPLPGGRPLPAVLARVSGSAHGGDRADAGRSHAGRIKEQWTQLAGPRGRAPGPGVPRPAPAGRAAARRPVVGGYWTRSNDVEIDLVGADRPGGQAACSSSARSSGWRRAAFDDHDLAALQQHRAALTDDPVPLVAVSRNGVTASGLDAVYGPDDLLAGWSRH